MNVNYRHPQQMMDAVREWIVADHGLVVDGQGFLAADVGRVRVFFEPNSIGHGEIMILKVLCVVLHDIEKSESMAVELLSHSDYNTYISGTWSVLPVPDSSSSNYQLLFEMSLLGANLDQVEWREARDFVSHVGNKHTVELQSKWGGKTWIEMFYGL